jgi:response regulator RpfG family c-di-GMP phosphodiesterase
MHTFVAPANPISVLVVDEEPSILISIARILDTNGMRALLARNGSEAVEIAQRSYIPIDLILTNSAILESHGPELLSRLRRVRPGVRHLCMAACVDGVVVRIQLMTGKPGVESAVYDDGLVESIRKAASAPVVRRAGHTN